MQWNAVWWFHSPVLLCTGVKKEIFRFTPDTPRNVPKVHLQDRGQASASCAISAYNHNHGDKQKHKYLKIAMDFFCDFIYNREV